jgi:hypothetical protein
MRERLPNRRGSETFDFEVPAGTAVLHYTATVGYYANGRIGELFLNNHKSNSTADTNARDARLHFRLPSSTAPRLKTSAARSVAIHMAAPPARSEPRLISGWGMNHEHRLRRRSWH